MRQRTIAQLRSRSELLDMSPFGSDDDLLLDRRVLRADDGGQTQTKGGQRGNHASDAAALMTAKHDLCHRFPYSVNT